jgi:type II secretory pathway pseudopilin PulG
VVKWLLAAVPVLGIVIAVGIPVMRYASKDARERAAITALGQVHAAQEAFKSRTGGYATELASLTALPSRCGAVHPVLAADVVAAIDGAGYALQLRVAHGAVLAGHDCEGRPLASDYYVAAAPTSSSAPVPQAFAAQKGGRIYLFYDGIPPREADIASGLATAVDERETFRIP